MQMEANPFIFKVEGDTQLEENSATTANPVAMQSHSTFEKD